MTNAIALALALIILTGLALDAWLYESENLIFLARRFTDILLFLAFWR
ncbi:MAG: hypothetical protein AAF755_09650 [Pseudomonadota bacterium]